MSDYPKFNKPKAKDALIADLLLMCAFAPGRGCRTKGRREAAPWCAVCRAAATLANQHASLVTCFDTIKRMNRRCQRAESVAEPRAYSDEGKRIARYMYDDVKAARAELAKAQEQLLSIEKTQYGAWEESVRRTQELRERGVTGVYFIKAGDFIKIGISRDVRKRLAQLGHALLATVPEPIGFVPAKLGDDWDLYGAEHALHSRFQHLNHRGEWFRDCEELRSYIQEHAQPWPQPRKGNPVAQQKVFPVERTG